MTTVSVRTTPTEMTEPLAAPELAAPELAALRALRDLFPLPPTTGAARFLGGGELGFIPSFDVKETNDAFVFEADLPGIEESDLEVRVSKNRLTVLGRREVEHGRADETIYTYERTHGFFTRSFALPDHVETERVKAELKNGVLVVELPKRAPVAARRVSIKSE